MRTITSEFVVKGRWTQYPGKEEVVEKLKKGEHPILKLSRNDEGQIVLLNSAGETAGCIPCGTSDDDDFDLLEAFIDLNLLMDVIALKVSKKKHYRVRVSAYFED